MHLKTSQSNTAELDNNPSSHNLENKEDNNNNNNNNKNNSSYLSSHHSGPERTWRHLSHQSPERFANPQYDYNTSQQQLFQCNVGAANTREGPKGSSVLGTVLEKFVPVEHQLSEMARGHLIPSPSSSTSKPLPTSSILPNNLSTSSIATLPLTGVEMATLGTVTTTLPVATNACSSSLHIPNSYDILPSVSIDSCLNTPQYSVNMIGNPVKLRGGSPHIPYRGGSSTLLPPVEFRDDELSAIVSSSKQNISSSFPPHFHKTGFPTTQQKQQTLPTSSTPNFASPTSSSIPPYAPLSALSSSTLTQHFPNRNISPPFPNLKSHFESPSHQNPSQYQLYSHHQQKEEQHPFDHHSRPLHPYRVLPSLIASNPCKSYWNPHPDEFSTSLLVPHSSSGAINIEQSTSHANHNMWYPEKNNNEAKNLYPPNDSSDFKVATYYQNLLGVTPNGIKNERTDGVGVSPVPSSPSSSTSIPPLTHADKISNTTVQNQGKIIMNPPKSSPNNLKFHIYSPPQEKRNYPMECKSEQSNTLEKRIGAYTLSERMERISKYKEKKRRAARRIRYRNRSIMAQKRPRIKGRFVKCEVPIRCTLEETGENVIDSNTDLFNPDLSIPNGSEFPKQTQ